MPQIIDGKLISAQIKEEVKEKVAKLNAQGTRVCLAVIQVGTDPASSVYVGNKKKACLMNCRNRLPRKNCLP